MAPLVVGVAWFAVAVGAVVALATRPEKHTRGGNRNRVVRVLGAIVAALAEGMRGLRDLRASTPAVAASIGAWVAQLLVVAVVLGALVPVVVMPAMIVFTFVMFTAAQAAPLLPGGIGTTQAAVMTPLIAMYGVASAQALAVAVVLPLALWLPVALIGWLAGAHAALREPLAGTTTQET
ncbi:MAG: lysylphosphatidylglycerol synthase domain-containing protein [Actinomycetota bacterium]|nr:lysylphosphatidylglycerol synthase domain-containing protein [Actinomycetota bacterium]